MGLRREAEILLGKLSYPVISRLPRLGRRVRVLLVCNNSLMVDYLARFAALFEEDERIEFAVLPPNWRTERVGTEEHLRRMLPFPQPRFPSPLHRQWDLIVAADHACPWLVDDRRYETLYIDHGIPSGKLVLGQEYSFGPMSLDEFGRGRYSALFTSSEMLAQRGAVQTPANAGRIRVVGSLENDQFLAVARERQAHRSRFGIKSDQKAVLIISSWGPDSLFRRVGDAVLSEVKRSADRFKFLVDIHPHEYRPDPSGGRVWGTHLRELSGPDFAMRDPSESWMPYMAAADLIVTDHTTLSLQSLPLGIPIIQVPYPGDPADFIEAGSPMWKLHTICPRLRSDARDLVEQIESALGDQSLRSAILDLATEVNSHPGRARERMRAEVYRLLALEAPCEGGLAPNEGCGDRKE